jgi:hypothetical protein
MFFFVGVLFFSANASAEEEESMTEQMKKYKFETVTTKEGLKFNVPSDMPILNKDGLVVPMPFEEYLYIKFKLIEERMKRLEDRIEKMETTISKEFKELKALIGARSNVPDTVPSQPAS